MMRIFNKIVEFFGFHAGRQSLRKNILVNFFAVILLLWISEAIIHHTILHRLLKSEFQRRGLNEAKSVAANSIVDILTQNSGRLNKLLENEKKLDKDIVYIFILNLEGQAIAHTFDKGFPVELAKANNLKRSQGYYIKTLDTRLGFIYDIAYPIFSEKSLLGEVHVGILRDNIQKLINMVVMIFSIIAVIVLLVGIFLLYRITYLITAPISKLVKAVGSIKKGNFSAPIYIEVRTKDEIGQLALAFNEMSSHLNSMIEEIKRLSAFEERNKIALDVHDTIAQDLVNIMKRIELCEKLSKIEPVKAIEELALLRNNTQEALNRTREVISELKSNEDHDFNLVSKLISYAENYQKINQIKVELKINALYKHILPAQAKAIYYIIIEALNNINKHSMAKNLDLNLGFDSKNGLQIHIKDDGKGFDIGSSGPTDQGNKRFGLISMQERAQSLGGKFVIRSMLNHGTEIFINMPAMQEINQE